MSRFIEVLNAHGSVVHVENITDILHAMQRKLKAATAHLEMEFPFFLSKKAPVTEMESLMDYVARFDATASAKDIDFCAHGESQRHDPLPLFKSHQPVWARTINADFAPCRFAPAKRYGLRI